jgi:hypothetical protein
MLSVAAKFSATEDTEQHRKLFSEIQCNSVANKLFNPNTGGTNNENKKNISQSTNPFHSHHNRGVVRAVYGYSRPASTHSASGADDEDAG